MIPNGLYEALRTECMTPVGSFRQASNNVLRFRVDGDKKGSENGWVRFFDDNSGACFGSWKTGLTYTWFDEGAVKLTREEVRHKQDEANRQKQLTYDEAAKKASWIWNNSTTATTHKYITKKSIKPPSVRIYKGVITIPIYNKQGNLCSLQFISPDGDKNFLGGGEIDGCFTIIGWKRSAVIVVTEGWSTGQTIHEATGFPVFVAFNSGNLPKAAINIRKRVGPKTLIVIAADNDKFITEEKGGNAGIKKGFQASKEVGGSLIYPIFEQDETGTDFNDLGIERTKKIFNKVTRW